MTGSGNDFVVIDNRTGLIATADLPAFSRAICRRGLGLGADGVVLIGQLLGYALTGAATQERMALNRQLPPVLAELPQVLSLKA